MCTTIEADIEDGRIRNWDSASTDLLGKAHVLITLVDISGKERPPKPNWETIKSQIGNLQLRTDTMEWQRRLRSD